MEEVIVKLVLGFVFAVLISMIWLKLGKKWGFVDYCDDPAKRGTITTGGIAIFASVVLLGLYFYGVGDLIIIFSAVFFIFGFVDDIKKIKGRQKDGLSYFQKILLQLAIAAVFSVIFFFKYTDNIPYLVLNAFLIMFFVNAVNVSDGLDGFAIGNYIIILCAVIVMLFMRNKIEIAGIAVIIVGACIAFLIFNKYPAKMFLGDAGAAFLGAALPLIVIMGKVKYSLFILMASFFVIEGLSSFLQILSKRSLGFRMFVAAPVHRVFLKEGWSEKKMVYCSWAFTFFVCLVGVLVFRFV